ncbi:hypothetical protein FBU30_006739 [Linnemannia zychae]|nr:hypothetical protein FBU30_006739 [Linnemannia zychae]
MNVNLDSPKTYATSSQTSSDQQDTLTRQPIQPQPPQAELTPQEALSVDQRQQENGDSRLEFQKNPVTNAPPPTRSPPASAATVPPEIIRLIVNYLDNRDLVKVITLNWTWAYWAVPQIWNKVDYTVQSSRLFFLITKSVAPPSPDRPSSTVVFAQSPQQQPPAPDISLSSSNLPPVYGSAPPLPASFTNTNIAADSGQPAVPPVRRRSYPWPTLLPYHSMIHALNVSLSTVDMVQDLLELIPCCTELRSFSLHSAIPTEDLMIRGVIASACNDTLDPLNAEDATGSTLPGGRNSFSSDSSASLDAFASGVHTSRPRSLTPHVDPYTISLNLIKGHQEADDDTIMTSSTSEGGLLFKLLSQSCPNLERIWLSGFHPVSVLGTPTDLRPRLVWERHLPAHFEESNGLLLPIASEASYRAPSIRTTLSSDTAIMDTSLPLACPVPGVNPAVVSPASTSPIIAAATTIQRQVQSKIHSIHLVNCTLPPQYLLICPGLKEITLHSTQNHRDSVTSNDILAMTQGLETMPGDTKRNDCRSVSATPHLGPLPTGLSLADFPLGTFNQAITSELANRARHPRLRRVEFGSEDPFDVGAELTRQLGVQRPELQVVWVNHGDTGDDRDD